MQKKTRSKVKPLVAAYDISLRKEGKQYKEIVELCNQIDKSESITLDWCKRNLKLVEKEVVTPEGKLEALCLEQIKALATLPKGITSSECKRIIKHNHNWRMLKRFISFTRNIKLSFLVWNLKLSLDLVAYSLIKLKLLLRKFLHQEITSTM